MTLLSTGPLENNAVGGVRPTTQVTVRIDNRSSISAYTVLIQGYYMQGVLEICMSAKRWMWLPTKR